MNAPVHFDPTEDAHSLSLDAIDVSDPKLYQNDIWYPYFERLRREDPVHYTKDGMYGSYWSVTKYKDIMHVETNHQLYSSEARLGGITIRDIADGIPPPQLHLLGPAVSRRAAQGGEPCRRADEPDSACRSRSASARSACWTGCRATRRSTGWSACRSS